MRDICNNKEKILLDNNSFDFLATKDECVLLELVSNYVEFYYLPSQQRELDKLALKDKEKYFKLCALKDKISDETIGTFKINTNSINKPRYFINEREYDNEKEKHGEKNTLKKKKTENSENDFEIEFIAVKERFSVLTNDGWKDKTKSYKPKGLLAALKAKGIITYSHYEFEEKYINNRLLDDEK